MKIAMIGPKKVPSRLGGVEIHVEEIGARLAARGHEVDIYNRGAYGTDEAVHRGMNLKHVGAHGRRGVHGLRGLYALLYCLKAAFKVSFMRYDIIHFHALGPATTGVIPLMAGKNLVCTVHGLDWQRSKWSKAGVLFLKTGEWVAGRLFHRTIIVSKPLTAYFQKKYQHQQRFVHIPNGIDMPKVALAHERKTDESLLHREYGVSSGSYYLFVSRLVPEKACHVLIDAYKKVNTDKKLIIAGDNPEDQVYVDKLNQWAQEDSRIVMAGFKGIDALNKLYAHAFCYILPSEIEGLPISLLEAMSHGCYCLTSDIQENAWVLHGFGKTFRSKDVTNLQQALESIEKETKAITEEYGQGKKGILQMEHVRETYNWDEVAEHTERVYQDLLHNQGL